MNRDKRNREHKSLRWRTSAALEAEDTDVDNKMFINCFQQNEAIKSVGVQVLATWGQHSAVNTKLTYYHF